MIYFDTETCGFHGPIVLIQWAEDDGPVILHSPWVSPIRETLEILEDLCNHEEGVCTFNMAFDWFHVCQMYTTLTLLASKVGDKEYPQDHKKLYAECEPLARDGLCLRPQSSLDLMMIARRGEYQSTMDRGDVRIRRVPMNIAPALCLELDQRILLKDVYFAKSSNPQRRWVAKYRDLPDGEMDTEFMDVVLEFRPTSALKALAQDALDLKDDAILKFHDIELSEKLRPKELGYAPFALANKEESWLDVIDFHITHWSYHKLARQYGELDVKYLQWLHHYFSARKDGKDKGESKELALSQGYDNLMSGGDLDSELCCMVAAVRWKGFRVDIPALEKMREKQVQLMKNATSGLGSPKKVLQYLLEVMDDTEKEALINTDGNLSTKGVYLEGIAKWVESEVCDDCYGAGCEKCDEGLILSDVLHPAAKRAKEVLDYRHAEKRINIINKFTTAGRFHASFKVIGTLSSRMAGGDGLNAQGVPHEHDFRSCFPLAPEDMVLSGGDFGGFEVSLADAVYGDPELRHDLQTGKKIHALFGQYLFPHKDYEGIMATAELAGDANLYSRAKQGVFALLYGGEGFTLKNRVGISEEVADKAYAEWCAKYKVWGDARKEIFNQFCSMRQPGGLGSKVEWHDPCDYAESMLGFRRYFTLENQIVKALFDLAEKLPKEFLKYKKKIVRREREQTESGAMRSALFGAAFGLQSANMRAAANHVIQSTGAELTKQLQLELWNIQPKGINHWRIVPMNIHDEVMTPVKSAYREEAKRIVESFVEKNKELVPLLEMDWSPNMQSWAEK